MMIPYTTERRADTGVTNVTLGIWLFLASEVMLFGALFSSYALLRVAAIDWPLGRTLVSLPLGSTNTIVLLVASLTVWRARTSTSAGIRRALAINSVLTGVFLAIKFAEYSHEISTGHLPSVNTFLAMYFTLTGLHALHVVVGIIANLWVLTGIRRVGDAMTAGRMRALSLYWIFVEVVWIVIFALFYLS